MVCVTLRLGYERLWLLSRVVSGHSNGERGHTVGGLMERPVWQGTEANSTGKELVQLHGNWKMQLTN